MKEPIDVLFMDLTKEIMIISSMMKRQKKTLSENARKTIEKKYTWDAVSSRFLRCYESLIGGD